MHTSAVTSSLSGPIPSCWTVFFLSAILSRMVPLGPRKEVAFMEVSSRKRLAKVLIVSVERRDKSEAGQQGWY